MKKRLLSILLALCMALSLAPIARAGNLKNYDPVGNLRWDGTTLRWNAVNDAGYYEVKLWEESKSVHVVQIKNTVSDYISFKEELNSCSDKNTQFFATISVKGNKEYNDSPIFATEHVAARALLNGYKTPARLGGGAVIGSAYPGSYLKPRYAGELYQYFRADETKLRHQWQRSATSNGPFGDISGETNQVYVVQDSDMDQFLRVRVWVDGCNGEIYSNVVQVEKGAAIPAFAPDLTVGTNTETGEKFIVVTNGHAHQEYIVGTRAYSDTSEIDWTGALSPESDGPFKLPCRTRAINYIYTRSKETATRQAGSGRDIMHSSIYVKEDDAPAEITSLKLEITDHSRKDEMGVEYMVGDILKLEVSATGGKFDGIRGDCWLLDYMTPEVLGYNAYYADPDCKTPLAADQYYTTAYAKLRKAKNDCCLSVYQELKSGPMLTAYQLINIADENGDYLVSEITLPKNIAVPAGNTAWGFQIMVEPSGGKLTGLLLECDQPGAPVITFEAEDCTLTVDATKAQPGDYEFMARFTDGREADVMIVKIEPPLAIPVEELEVNPGYIELAPGQSVHVEILTSPMGAVPELVFTISNEKVLSYDPVTSTLTVASDVNVGNIQNLLVTVKGTELSKMVIVEVISREDAGLGEEPETPETPASAAGASAWAVEEVSAAIIAGIVPDELQSNYQKNITRAEFCRLMVRLVSTALDTNMRGLMSDKGLLEYGIFSDTDDEDILTAYAMGIVNGMGDGTFAPDGSLTREQAATMLARTANFLDLTSGMPIDFADADSFSSWARNGIAFVSGLVDPVSSKAVMGGVGDNRFSPQTFYTREQAILTALRLYHCYIPAGK